METRNKGPRIVDLTGSISTGMWDYNALGEGLDLPPVQVDEICSIEQNGCSIHSMQLTGLSNCYVETARHMNPEAPWLDAFEASSLVRPAKIMRLPQAEPYTLYDVEDFRRHDPGIEPGEALIVETGWGRRVDSPDYISAAPAWSIDTLDWLVEQRFSILAGDTPVAPCLWADKVDPPKTSEIGQDLLGGLYERCPDMLLVAPVVNLHQVQTDEGTIIALPLPIPGVAAAPARVLFMEGVRLGA